MSSQIFSILANILKLLYKSHLCVSTTFSLFVKLCLILFSNTLYKYPTILICIRPTYIRINNVLIYLFSQLTPALLDLFNCPFVRFIFSSTVINLYVTSELFTKSLSGNFLYTIFALGIYQFISSLI